MQSVRSQNRKQPHAATLLLVALALAFLAACERPPEPAAGPPLRVGAYYWPGMYWVDIAHHQGWFREAGLNVEWVDTNPDYFKSFDDLFNDKLDVVAFALFDLILYNARGQRVVGFLTSDYSSGAEALIARPGIRGVPGLAGKKLALSKGTYLEYIWTVVAHRAGLDPNAVRIVDTPAEKAHELLARGTVDAILTWEPYASQGLDAVKGTRLFDTAQLPGLLWTVYSTRPEVLETRKAELQAFVRVWHRTAQFIQRQPEQAYAIVAEVNKKTPAEVRDFVAKDRVLGLRDNLTAFSFATGFGSLHGATRQMNDFMVRRGIAARQLDTAPLFDSHMVRALSPVGAK